MSQIRAALTTEKWHGRLEQTPCPERKWNSSSQPPPQLSPIPACLFPLPKSNFLKPQQTAPSFSHLGRPNTGSIWSPGSQMLMRLSVLKQLCVMNGPKKELLRDTFTVKKSFRKDNCTNSLFQPETSFSLANHKRFILLSCHQVDIQPKGRL